jgi:hypothetical protein
LHRLNRPLALPALAWILPLFLFCASAAPDVGFWDTGEMQTVPAIFGVAHPTGFPAYVLLGGIFARIWVFGAVAWRMTVFSALSTAATAWVLAEMLRTLRLRSPFLRIATAALFACGEIVWRDATRTEIHTLALLVTSLAVLFALRAWRGDLRGFFLSPLLLGLALATHPVALWTMPGIALLLGDALRRARPRRKARALRNALFGCASAIALFAACYATIPIFSLIHSRARSDPTLALGLPPGEPFWDYGHPQTLKNFLWLIEGKEFDKHGAMLAILDLTRYPSYLLQYVEIAAKEFTWPTLPFIAAGIGVLFARSRVMGFAFLALLAAGIPFALAYSIEIDNERYLLFSLFVAALLIALGADGIARKAMPRHRGIAPAAVALAAIALLVSNRELFKQRNEHEARAFLDRIVAHTPSNAVIVAPWVYATPMGYASYVEHRFGSRIVVTSELPDLADRYAAWARRRPLYLIDEGAATYSQPSLRLTQMDAAFPRIERVELE